jgi:hypothetical protein
MSALNDARDFFEVGKGTTWRERRDSLSGVIDYDGQMSAGYARGRALSPAACSVWCTIVAPFVQTLQSTRILDLGSGTGQNLYGERVASL